MRKTTLRQLGLGSCMLLTVLSGMPFGARPARAAIQCTTSSGIQTCVNTVTTEVISVTQVGPVSQQQQSTWTQPTITAQQFTRNPSLLLQNSTALGANVQSLLQQGVSTRTLSQVLNSAGAGGLNQSQWQSMLNNLRSGSNSPQSVASLVNGTFAGAVPPQLAQALGSMGNLGNISSISGLTNLLGSSQISNALRGLSASAAGQAIDQILQGALGNLSPAGIASLATQAGMQALTSAIGGVAPQLLGVLGAGGIQSALTGALSSLATNPLGALSSGILGGAITGGLGGAVGSALGLGLGIGSCLCTVCMVEIPKHHNQIRTEVTSQFATLQRWMMTQFFSEQLLPALMLMAEQLTVVGMYQVEIIGAFLDAKHQLETQRLFQQLTAKAHKDYHPSEGMCTFGTTVRSLAMSDRKSNIAQTALASRMMQRQNLSGDGLSTQGEDSDIRARLATYIATYCDAADNQNYLNTLCKTPVPDPARRNIDIDYTRNVESRLTLDMEFADIPPPGGGSNNPNPTTTVTPDEQDVFALGANLFAHNLPHPIDGTKFGKAPDKVRTSAAEKYLDLRAVYAKRSVAQNSFAALVAMRTAGDAESAPYVKAVMRELGVSNPQEIDQLLGKNPSYFAQMEVLTKKLYQNPTFYTELYDKPVNVERKGAALQAIGLMQDRDLYNSLLRSEAVLSVLLEVELQREQDRVTTAKGRVSTTGGAQ